MHDIQYKTLVIRFSSVGDIVLSSPLVRALRQLHPQMQVDFLVKETFVELVRYNPHLSNVFTFPKNGGIGDLLKFRREIRNRRYDMILDIHSSLRSRFLTIGLHGVRRIRKRVIARTILVRFKRDVYSHFGGAPGVAERYLETLRSGRGREGQETGLELFYPREVGEKMREQLASAGIVADAAAIGVCPSARHFTKIWPAERYATVATALARRWEAPVFLIGSDDDAERCRMIAERIAQESPGTRVMDFSGHCSLLEAAALMDACRIILTNDSGLMHIASARRRPVVAVFGSTVRQFGFFPSGPLQRVVEHPNLSCRPCSHIGRPDCPRKHFRCMLDLSTQRVLDAANELIGRDQPPLSASSSIN